MASTGAPGGRRHVRFAPATNGSRHGASLPRAYVERIADERIVTSGDDSVDREIAFVAAGHVRLAFADELPVLREVGSGRAFELHRNAAGGRAPRDIEDVRRDTHARELIRLRRGTRTTAAGRGKPRAGSGRRSACGARLRGA